MSIGMDLPRMRPLSGRRSAVVAALDVGTSKIACLIGKLDLGEYAAARGGARGVKIIGIGVQRASGLKGGQIINMAEAESAIRLTVDAAERMAGTQIEKVIVSLSGGRISARRNAVTIPVHGRFVDENDLRRARAAALGPLHVPGRAILHCLTTRCALDGVAVRDPKGMAGETLSVELHAASCDAAALRNLGLAVERCHLRIESFVASPYASAFSVLEADEAEIGVTVIDLGGGTSTVSVFSHGALAHVDAIALGGNHITLDIARGLNIRVNAAERLKLLYGRAVAAPSDDRETISVEGLGDGHEFTVSRAKLVQIVRPRVDEILELLRERLSAHGFAPHPGARVVLTGGTSQLAGICDAARRVIGGQPRLGRPAAIAGLPEVAKNPAFAASAGLLFYPQAAADECFDQGDPRDYARAPSKGYISRMGRWLKESF